MCVCVCVLPRVPVVILSRLVGSSASRFQVVENHRLGLSTPLRQSDQELRTTLEQQQNI